MVPRTPDHHLSGQTLDARDLEVGDSCSSFAAVAAEVGALDVSRFTPEPWDRLAGALLPAGHVLQVADRVAGEPASFVDSQSFHIAGVV